MLKYTSPTLFNLLVQLISILWRYVSKDVCKRSASYKVIKVHAYKRGGIVPELFCLEHYVWGHPNVRQGVEVTFWKGSVEVPYGGPPT